MALQLANKLPDPSLHMSPGATNRDGRRVEGEGREHPPRADRADAPVTAGGRFTLRAEALSANRADGDPVFDQATHRNGQPADCNRSRAARLYPGNDRPALLALLVVKD
ncbi:MAG: hypothetical protein H7Z74_13065 [Anaerolineae bacterium]|nr:hypothetical protein [Gemmatimonadaceae bacterium]